MQGSSLEVVKSSYKKVRCHIARVLLSVYLLNTQLALSTHPDKNPGNADATAQFQIVSEAYNILVKHLDKSTRPPRERSSRVPRGGPFSFGFSFDGDDDDDEYDDDGEYYDEDEYNDEEENMGFYMQVSATTDIDALLTHFI